MTEPNDFHLTSGDGSIFVEIIGEWAPITPEVLARPRIRAPWLRDSNSPPLTRSSPDEARPENPN
jgi:hypothetical protein